MDDTRRAFFYGTLMAPAVLHRVIHGTTKPEPWQQALISVRPAILQNYQRRKVRGADYPAIVSQQSSTVRGSVVSGLNDQDIRRLDIFEGDQYERKVVTVEVMPEPADITLQPGQNVQAETYVWIEPESQLESQEWDFDEFRREKMWAWIGETRNANVNVDEGFEDVDQYVREQNMKDGQNVVARELEDQVDADPTGGRGIGGRITKELESLGEPSSGSGTPRVVGEQEVWKS